MDHQNQRYAELARKWLDGTITEAEKKEFNQWYEQTGEDPLQIPSSFAPSEEALRRRMLHRITEQKKGPATIFRLNGRTVWRVAAVLLLLVGSTVAYLNQSRTVPTYDTASYHKPVKENGGVNKDLLPGGNNAILVLADGSTIELNTANNGVIAGDSASRVVKLKEGQLQFSTNSQAKAVGQHTLTTPRGGQYAVTLSDGTAVWLNSSSSLHFPQAFTGNERLVELTGEGYFEVAKDLRRPFKVKVAGMEVQVLGTHFNVMAYPDEEAVRTTLLEGSVRIRQDAATAMLKPGQQAAVKESGTIRISHHADIDQVVAWKNGYFNFEGATIETIMRQLARWYPIDVVYAAKVPVHFTGTISKNVGIEKVFKMLELTGGVRFTIDGSLVKVHQ